MATWSSGQGCRGGLRGCLAECHRAEEEQQDFHDIYPLPLQQERDARLKRVDPLIRVPTVCGEIACWTAGPVIIRCKARRARSETLRDAVGAIVRLENLILLLGEAKADHLSSAVGIRHEGIAVGTGQCKHLVQRDSHRLVLPDVPRHVYARIGSRRGGPWASAIGRAHARSISTATERCSRLTETIRR